MTPEPDLDAVARALGHRFTNCTLLRDALTHRSFANEYPARAPEDNERLEFLGDAVLGLGASTLLWAHFPGASEGELTRRRADLVRETALADVARVLGIGEALRLGRGEAKSGGRHKPRLLCSALEACIAAVYVDGGPEVATQVVHRLLAPRLLSPELGQRDHKTRLQERMQAQGQPAPRYVVVETTGPDHARAFRVSCVCGERELATGEGRTKLEAEQLAARVALDASPSEEQDDAS